MKVVSFLQQNAACRQRGVAAPVVIAALLIVVLVALAAWYLIFRPSQTAVVAPTQALVAASSIASAPPPADVESMSVSQLLGEASKAMREQRLLAPAGNNAFEFYLNVLDRDPGNQAALDALRETFPFGANAAEQEINAGNFDEAQREIDVLTRADSGNYTLTILRSKLDAQRKLAARAEEQEKLQEQLAQQRAGAQTQTAQQEQEQQQQQQLLEQQQAAAAAEAEAEARRRAAAAAQPEPVAPAAAAPEPQQPSVVVPARLVHESTLRYPPQALRRRQEGWVDVEFTVNAAGNVVNARVIQADGSGSRVFERAALNSVEEREYEPATENGQPVDSVLRQRIHFRL